MHHPRIIWVMVGIVVLIGAVTALRWLGGQRQTQFKTPNGIEHTGPSVTFDVTVPPWTRDDDQIFLRIKDHWVEHPSGATPHGANRQVDLAMSGIKKHREPYWHSLELVGKDIGRAVMGLAVSLIIVVFVVKFEPAILSWLRF